MNNVLSVATAGLIPDYLHDASRDQNPRVDYIELERLLIADTLDYSTYDSSFAGKFFRGMETRLRSDIYLATIGWWMSKKYQVVFTWSERAGIPFAAYKRLIRSDNRFVTMFQSWSSRQKETITRLGLFSVMDEILVHCSSMKQLLVSLGADESKITVVHYSIDQDYFSPSSATTPQQDLIFSVGETRSRDYKSLFRAVDGIPISLEIAGYGHWYAREKSSRLHDPAPGNVTLSRRLSQAELRASYARSQFVVLPVRDLVYSAGATVALEAGSMARAVIAFRSQGIADYLIDGETGILVDPGDVLALKEAIRSLLANPREAKRLGENARQRILERFSLESYVHNIANVIKRA